MIQLKDWDITDKEETSFIEHIYTDAFPHSERRGFDVMAELYKNTTEFQVQVVINKSQPIGFLTFWNLGDFVFAEHFAIAPKARNSGIGGKVMRAFMNEQTNPIVLEVELPTTILSERRIGFYQRLGYKLWNKYSYQQPPYHTDGSSIPMYLMTFGNINVDKDYSIIKEKIYSDVYNC